MVDWLHVNSVFLGGNFISVNGFEVSQAWLSFLSFSRFLQENCGVAQPLTTIVPHSPSSEDIQQSCSIWLKFRGTCTGTKIKKSTNKIIPATWSLSNVKRKYREGVLRGLNSLITTSTNYVLELAVLWCLYMTKIMTRNNDALNV